MGGKSTHIFIAEKTITATVYCVVSLTMETEILEATHRE